MAMVGVDLEAVICIGRLTASVVWLGLGFYIHQMNRVNSRNGSAMMTAP